VFNGQSRDSLRRIEISGERVVIAPSGSQGLLERLMPGGVPAADVDSVDIYAKEVTVGAPLRLPGATVRIFARSLTFEDHDTSLAYVSTTPDGLSPVTTAGANGADGQDAGDIYLYVRELHDSAPHPVLRLLAQGATGQQGGPQTPARRGNDLPELGLEPQIGGIVRSWKDLAKRGADRLPASWEQYATPKHVVWFNRVGNDEYGHRDQWPGDATPGQPGGVPGRGGQGGTLHTAIPIPGASVALDGGRSAAARPAADGERGGLPEFAVGIAIRDTVIRAGPISIHVPIYEFYTHQSHGVQAVPSPGPVGPTGAAGGVAVDLAGWLHPVAARAMLGYAEDLYRLGLLTQARDALQFLNGALAGADTLRGQAAHAYLPLRERTEALLARQSSNLDYFGNPGGWVPALNLPALLGVLNNETRASADLLVLTERLRTLAEQGAAHVQSLTASRDGAADEVTRLASTLDSLAVELPRLQTHAATVAQEEASFETAVTQREATLAAIAQDQATPRTSFLQGALKTLAIVAKVIPVGQPIIGAAGAALDLVSQVGDRPAGDILGQIPNVAAQFSQENVAASLTSYRKTVNDVKSLDLQHPKAVFDEV
jgi:hypothetical protein